MIEISVEELKKYYVRRSKIEEAIRFLNKESEFYSLSGSPLLARALFLCVEHLERILND